MKPESEMEDLSLALELNSTQLWNISPLSSNCYTMKCFWNNISGVSSSTTDEDSVSKVKCSQICQPTEAIQAKFYLTPWRKRKGVPRMRKSATNDHEFNWSLIIAHLNCWALICNPTNTINWFVDWAMRPSQRRSLTKQLLITMKQFNSIPIMQFFTRTEGETSKNVHSLLNHCSLAGVVHKFPEI